MKISEMNTDQFLDLVCELTPHVIELFEDGELLHELENVSELTEGIEGEEQAYKTGLSMIKKLVPMLLKNKRKQVIAITAIINNKSVEELEKQNPIKTIKEVTNMLMDKDLKELFLSSMS